MKRIQSRARNEKRRLKRMKDAKVPIEKVLQHTTCVRSTLRKGSRSGVVKYDRYVNTLFKEELDEYRKRESVGEQRNS